MSASVVLEVDIDTGKSRSSKTSLTASASVDIHRVPTLFAGDSVVVPDCVMYVFTRMTKDTLLRTEVVIEVQRIKMLNFPILFFHLSVSLKYLNILGSTDY